MKAYTSTSNQDLSGENALPGHAQRPNSSRQPPILRTEHTADALCKFIGKKAKPHQ